MSKYYRRAQVLKDTWEMVSFLHCVICKFLLIIYYHLSQLHHEKNLTILYLLVLAVQLSVKECRQKMKTDLLSRWSSTKTAAVGNKEF